MYKAGFSSIHYLETNRKQLKFSVFFFLSFLSFFCREPSTYIQVHIGLHIAKAKIIVLSPQ